MITAQECLMQGLHTMNERQEVYGPAGFVEHGELFKAIFPKGVTLKTAADFSRFVLLVNIGTKMCRYAKNFEAGGHPDSIHDLGNYGFILEAYDRNLEEQTCSM